MENITTGHWIFAGIFAIAFLIYLFISYRKDLRLHKIHYKEWRYSGLTTNRHYPVRFVCLQASDVAPILSYICKEFNSTLSHDRKAEKRNQLPGV